MAEVIEKRSEVKNTTPMMKQYLEVKDEYSDHILLYRLGDFYECFFDDAILASRVLELTLTGRDCGEGKRAAMCGVPFHKADLYVGRLVEKGYKVAICEQVEDPKSATGLVKREVVRVVTPGTLTDASILKAGSNNFLTSICYGVSGVAVCFADISTGDVSGTYITGDETELRLENEIGAYQPAEAIINVNGEECKEIISFMRDRFDTLVTDGAKSLFTYEKAKESIRSVFPEELSKLSEPELIMAIGALLSYIKQTQMCDGAFSGELNIYTRGECLELDYNTRRNLELCESMRNREKRGSLLWVLDKTDTAMGARMLRSFITRPLVNPIAIGKRQSAVRAMLTDRQRSEELKELLSGVLDIERLCARAVYGTANAKDLRAIYTSISVLPRLKELIMGYSCDYISELASGLDTLTDISELLGAAIVENPPFSVREGGMIAKGFNVDVDYYRSIRDNGTEIMRSIEQREKEETGIKTLKVDYNKVFGYYIEVSKSFVNEVPDRYIRKQTLTNCERYLTQELKEMENAIFSADEKLVELEFELFSGLRRVVVDNSDRIRRAGAIIAELDVFLSFATVSRKNGYVCPEVDLSSELIIKDGRHPVVEKFVSDSYFVPNDTCLDNSNNRVMIITGPNMAGKSTYMRQVAIITIMAQIGCFVPAKEAKIGVVDKVFTRVGASDDLASGQSTFMLEMNEVAHILKNATKRSLIIYDEVGRGTSTYDGMAIARAVVEYTNSKKIGAKTLFATHYHELTDMEEELEGVVNYNIAAKKRGDKVIFLRKIVRGGTDDSFGIEVAKLAGVPQEVVRRAREILSAIESDTFVLRTPKQKTEQEDDLFSAISSTKERELSDRVRALDINTTTPIEAMSFLFELKRLLDE